MSTALTHQRACHVCRLAATDINAKPGDARRPPIFQFINGVEKRTIRPALGSASGSRSDVFKADQTATPGRFPNRLVRTPVFTCPESISNQNTTTAVRLRRNCAGL